MQEWFGVHAIQLLSSTQKRDWFKVPVRVGIRYAGLACFGLGIELGFALLCASPNLEPLFLQCEAQRNKDEPRTTEKSFAFSVYHLHSTLLSVMFALY